MMSKNRNPKVLGSKWNDVQKVMNADFAAIQKGLERLLADGADPGQISPMSLALNRLMVNDSKKNNMAYDWREETEGQLRVKDARIHELEQTTKRGGPGQQDHLSNRK